MTYICLQQYWWFLISLLGAILVFLLFVQGGNSLIFTIGKDKEERRLLINSTGRKWELTFTTLVTFGGAFFASFPLFYSTSFGGAYWLWMLILLSFVLQAISYEFQNKLGNFLGVKPFQWFLVINGILGPLLLGGAVATFFNGSNFFVNKENITNNLHPVISSWANASNGLDALLDPWNLVFGFAVMFLARVLGSLYFINNINDKEIRIKSRHQTMVNGIAFLILFLAFIIRTLLKDGFSVNHVTGQIFMEPYKYFTNFITLWWLLILFLVGVILVLFGGIKTYLCNTFHKGIWFVGIGVIFVVLALLMSVGYNDTAYYPSTCDLQSSLTLANSCSSEFTLRTMAWVSLFIPFVLAYIVYTWHAMDKKEIEKDEIKSGISY